MQPRRSPTGERHDQERLLQRLQAIRFRGSQVLLLLESHPLTLDREAEVRSHVVWLRVCVTAADDHLAIGIESPRCRARRLLWNRRAWVADQKWLSATEELMSVKEEQCNRNEVQTRKCSPDMRRCCHSVSEVLQRGQQNTLQISAHDRPTRTGAHATCTGSHSCSAKTVRTRKVKGPRIAPLAKRRSLRNEVLPAHRYSAGPRQV
jgi:hypothetical protein